MLGQARVAHVWVCPSRSKPPASVWAVPTAHTDLHWCRCCGPAGHTCSHGLPPGVGSAPSAAGSCPCSAAAQGGSAVTDGAGLPGPAARASPGAHLMTGAAVTSTAAAVRLHLPSSAGSTAAPDAWGSRATVAALERGHVQPSACVSVHSPEAVLLPVLLLACRAPHCSSPASAGAPGTGRGPGQSGRRTARGAACQPEVGC